MIRAAAKGQNQSLRMDYQPKNKVFALRKTEKISQQTNTGGGLDTSWREVE